MVDGLNGLDECTHGFRTPLSFSQDNARRSAIAIFDFQWQANQFVIAGRNIAKRQSFDNDDSRAQQN